MKQDFLPFLIKIEHTIQILKLALNFPLIFRMNEKLSTTCPEALRNVLLCCLSIAVSEK